MAQEGIPRSGSPYQPGKDTNIHNLVSRPDVPGEPRGATCLVRHFFSGPWIARPTQVDAGSSGRIANDLSVDTDRFGDLRQVDVFIRGVRLSD